MLARENRMVRSADFTRCVRSGVRGSGRSLTVHLLPGGPSDTGRSPAVGFVVSKAVGNAVVRNRVQRRLRHLARTRVAGLGNGDLLVVRAQPAAAAAGSVALDADLDQALAAAHRRIARRAAPSATTGRGSA